jgi:hypothetical protein
LRNLANRTDEAERLAPATSFASRKIPNPATATVLTAAPSPRAIIIVTVVTVVVVITVVIVVAVTTVVITVFSVS